MDCKKEYHDSRPKTHPVRAKFRKQKADMLRAARHYERVMLPRIEFLEETITDQLQAGKMTPQEALKLLEDELLAIGMEPDCSVLWQVLFQEVL